MSKINSLEALKKAFSQGRALSLDEIDISFLNSINRPFQPESSEELESLREWFYKELSAFMGKDPLVAADKESIDKMVGHFHSLYGGPVRMYERFWIARGGNIAKVHKMMQEMLALRKRVVGDALVTNVTTTGNINDQGNIQDKAEVELIRGIHKYWAIEYYGFSSQGKALLTAKLKGIEPGKFIKNYTKEQIEKYYFYFVELGNLIISISNSPPLKQPPEEGSKYMASKLVEIYDFEGISRKQMSISGLRVLRDVLGLGQVLFPEQTEQTLMINTPWFFSASWALVSVALNKRSREKIAITRDANKAQVARILGDEDLMETLFDRVLAKTAQ